MTQRYELKQKAIAYKRLLSDEALSHLPDFNIRLKVLRQLKYIDEDSTVLLKGRVACEVR